MKGIYLLLFSIYFPTLISYSQTILLEENFNYTPGTNLEDNGWSIKSGSSNSILVESTNLSYPGYSSSSGGSVKVDASGFCYYKSIGSIITSGSVYVSFLVNIVGAYAGSNDYFIFSLGSTAAGTQAGRLYIKKGDSNFAFGLTKANGIPSYTAYSYNFSTTYLIVIKYSIVSGSTNDFTNLYVVDGAIPANDSNPTISVTGETSNDPANIEVVYIRQDAASNVSFIDGIRVADNWFQAPLPVELTTFTAILFDSKVILDWETATEVNNFGFNIETRNENSEWRKIGFVHGHGNSNSPKKYFFSDDYPPVGKILYRLKQIDFDGDFEYSKIVNVLIAAPKKFELQQNYPNPFNPITEIRYLVPSTSHIQLSIYNSIGQRVITVVDEIQNAGIHTIKFDGSNLSSGVYLYKLSSIENSIMKKMVLLK
jgi:hypothetical protein